MQKWEYKVVEAHSPYEGMFNELGAEGWELVSTIYDAYYNGYFIFKRPKS